MGGVRATDSADRPDAVDDPESSEVLSDPCVVVLAGAAGSGKSTWAAARYTRSEIVSTDALRSVVGTGPADLDASTDAFAVADLVVGARLRRRLTTVIDSLGLEPVRRRELLQQARAAGLPAMLVILDTPPALCRSRNAERDRPVPADALTSQLRKVRALRDDAPAEGWDRVIVVTQEKPSRREPVGEPVPGRSATDRPAVVLQLSRFPWGKDPSGWLRDLAVTADQVGFAGIALMDHLIQIPQVDRAWEPIPEPWVTLGLLAGLDTDLRLGTLVSPVTLRPAGIIAKTAATLDVLSGGRAFCGLGAGWWEREHAAYGIDFPPPRERLDRLAATIETCRALWSTGTKPYTGRRLQLPETTCYPRPVGRLPIIVGGGGERRTLRIAAELADGCNLRVDDTLPRKIEIFSRCRDAAGRTSMITVLDLPVIGRDREDVGRRVERVRGRLTAQAYAARHPVGTVETHRRRYADLADQGVEMIFVALSDLSDASDLEPFAELFDDRTPLTAGPASVRSTARRP
jgi:alkanesulfonate monooxygenase SsuD/methylene tetrahydromethanopterin reductase-like flavin-dependent oxidoreductase (luciferase family)/predicted kinase